MSDATLEHFGNRIRGIGAFIQELPTSDSGNKKTLFGLLHEVRADLLAISRMVDRAIEGTGSVPEHSSAPEDPAETLAMIVKGIDESIEGLSSSRRQLFKCVSGSLLGRVYVRIRIAPLINDMIDRLHDLAGAIESMKGNDGEFLSGSELLRHIG